MDEEEAAEPTTAAGFAEVAKVHTQQEEQSESEVERCARGERAARTAFPAPPHLSNSLEGAPMPFLGQPGLSRCAQSPLNECTTWDRLSPVPHTLNTNDTHQSNTAFGRATARAKIPPKS